MIHFPCAHCAADIRVHERATEATCPACQTPQSIPETAAPVSAPMLDRSRTRMDGKPLDFETPRYAGALFTAAGLIMGGVFAILWGIIAFLSPNLLAGLILVGAGLFALTLGQILALVRTIAQQTAPHRQTFAITANHCPWLHAIRLRQTLETCAHFTILFDSPERESASESCDSKPFSPAN